MAGVNDRGQLLLAGAFVLAVTLIGLTLVFSASDYTTVLASEESGISQGSDAITTRESVRADLENGLQAVHRDHSAPRNNYITAYQAILPQLATETRAYHARQGRLVNVSNPTFENGEQLRQTTARFSKPGDRASSPHWTVATGTTVRNATFVFTDLTGFGNPRFTVAFGTDWQMEVYEGSAGNDYKVTVRGPSDAWTCTRSGTSNPMTVDVSEATVDGDHCHALTALDPGTGYDLEFQNGNDARGRYWLTVPASTATPPTDFTSFNEREEAVYAVEVDYRYQSSTVDYVTPIRVAPGEIE